MDFLIHYLAQNPDFLGFFLFGWLFALGVSFWNRAMQSCLTGAVYLYVFGAFSLTMVLLPLLTARHSKEFILFGFLAYHIKTIFRWTLSALRSLFDHYQERKHTQRAEQWEQEQAQKRQQQQKAYTSEQQERARQEQARREQEARQYREQQERAKREQEQQRQRSQSQQQNHQRQNQQREAPKDPPPRQPPPNLAPDTRTPEQVLGLATGYTQDDLKTAYRRESQKLHPDKWAGKPEAIQQAMEAEFKAVQQAYNRLKKQ